MAVLHKMLLRAPEEEVAQSLRGVLPKGMPDDVRRTRRPFCPFIVGLVCIPLYSLVHRGLMRAGVKTCRIGIGQRLRADPQ